MDELKRIIGNAGDVTDALQEMNNEIRQLDEEVNNLMIDVKQKTLNFCKNQKKLSRDAKTKAAKEIQATHNVIAEKSSKKMEIANKMYDFIDNKIQHLDEATSNFNKELLKKTAEKQNDVKDVRKALRESAASSSTSSSNRALKKIDVEESARKIPDFKPIRVESAIPVNPNEPRYCVCNQVSFGEMIACDNPNCKYEWFHYQCLGIKKAPAGEFICKFCLEKGFKKKK